MIMYKCLRGAAVALVVLQVAFAQKCYYPNGDEAPDSEKPCSSAEGTACCPEKWQCNTSGLCYYEPEDLYGRYSCTDQSWKSPGCPSNLCTYDMTAAGGESIAFCNEHSSNSAGATLWCCDANGQDVDCCNGLPEPRPFFTMQQPLIAYGTAGGKTGSTAPNLATVTGKALNSKGDSPTSTAPSSNSASVTKAATGSSASSGSSATSVQTTIASGSGGLSTLIVTTVLAPSSSSGPTAAPATSSESNSNTGLIVGCAVGIPLAIALLGILYWFYRRRAYKKAVSTFSSTADPHTSPSASPVSSGDAKFAHSATNYESVGPGVPELAGHDVVPASMIPGKAEMDSGGGFAPGTVSQSPHFVGMGGGNGVTSMVSSWGTAPPTYSPGQNQATWAPGLAHRSSPDGTVSGDAASQHSTGGYIPYRPSQSQAAPGALGNAPQMAELPAATSPRGVAELGNPSPPARLGSETQNP